MDSVAEAWGTTGGPAGHLGHSHVNCWTDLEVRGEFYAGDINVDGCFKTCRKGERKITILANMCLLIGEHCFKYELFWGLIIP